MGQKQITWLAVMVVAAVLLTGLCNILDQMRHAEGKEFWLDEKVGLYSTMQKNSYLGLLAKAAAKSEANAAPLDFLGLKMLDAIKTSVGSFGLSDRVYYRLWANMAMIGCGIVIVCIFAGDIVRQATAQDIKILQLLLLFFLPLTYLYRPLPYYYAAEARPYALWFALWLISIAVCLRPQINKLLLTFMLSLLAMTMVGSIFQIVAVAAAFGMVQARQKGWQQAVLETLQVSIIPLALAVYYAYPASYGHGIMEPRSLSWSRLMQWWGRESGIIPLLLLAIGSFGLSGQTRPMSLGPLAVLLVFLMGPLILMMTLSRGYFYTERQYIYYHAHRAVLWLCWINLLPIYLERLKGQGRRMLVMALIFVLSVFFVCTKKTVTYSQMVFQNALMVLHPSNHP